MIKSYYITTNFRRRTLAELVNTMDPTMVAAAFGMNPQGVKFYLTDHVDDVGLPATPSNPANP